MPTLVLALMCASSVKCAVHKKLQVRIHLDKKTYLLGEPIFLDVYVANETGDTVMTAPVVPSDNSLEIVLVDQSGRRLKDTGFEDSPLSGLFGGDIALDPGETWYTCLNLIETNGISDTESTIKPHSNGRVVQIYPVGNYFLRYLPVGTYTIRVGHDSCYSNESKFAVIFPHGREEQAYRDMIETYRQFGEDPDQYTNLTPGLRTFANKYPKSLYREKLFMDLCALTGDLQTFQKAYPNSGFNRIAIGRLASSASNKVELLHRMISEFPGTRSAAIAEQMLKMKSRIWPW